MQQFSTFSDSRTFSYYAAFSVVGPSAWNDLPFELRSLLMAHHDVAYHGTCEDQLRNPQTAEVCVSVSHAGRDSSSGAKFNPEPNRLLQRRLCRLATTQHHSAPGCHQRCCSSDSASRKV